MKAPAALILTGMACTPANAGLFIFAEGQENPRLIAHPTGYTGTQNTLNVSVCIDPGSESIAEMEVPVRNTVTVWNRLDPVLGNTTLNNPQLGSSQVDYESVLLHELGHCIGLAHPNLATESGLTGTDRRYAKTLPGDSGTHDLDPGEDGVIGTRTDLRGDDINMNWFRIGVNDPFIHEQIIDATTYSVNTNDLPAGHNFVEVAGLQVAQRRGLPNDEAVMYQGTRIQETKRELNRDDASMIRLGMSGIDRLQDSAADYELVLEYGGVAEGCDITVTTEGPGFGVCSVSGTFFMPNHIQITSGTITMGSAETFNWFFNTELLEDDTIFADRFESE